MAASAPLMVWPRPVACAGLRPACLPTTDAAAPPLALPTKAWKMMSTCVRRRDTCPQLRWPLLMRFLRQGFRPGPQGLLYWRHVAPKGRSLCYCCHAHTTLTHFRCTPLQANSAILNALLTLLNERLFDNGSQRLPVPLLCLASAYIMGRLGRGQLAVWHCSWGAAHCKHSTTQPSHYAPLLRPLVAPCRRWAPPTSCPRARSWTPSTTAS